MSTTHPSKIDRKAHLVNPKKNPLCRRRFNHDASSLTRRIRVKHTPGPCLHPIHQRFDLLVMPRNVKPKGQFGGVTIAKRQLLKELREVAAKAA